MEVILTLENVKKVSRWRGGLIACVLVHLIALGIMVFAMIDLLPSTSGAIPGPGAVGAVPEIGISQGHVAGIFLGGVAMTIASFAAAICIAMVSYYVWGPTVAAIAVICQFLPVPILGLVVLVVVYVGSGRAIARLNA